MEVELVELRITYVSPYYSPSLGGIETFCNELATRVARRGHEVHVITYSKADGLDAKSQVSVHRIEPLLKWYKTRYSPLLGPVLSKTRPDIVHVQSPAPVTENVAVRGKWKCISTYHNDPMLSDELPYRLSRLIYKGVLFDHFRRKVSRVITPSRAFRDASKFLRMVPRERLGVIPNGVDTIEFSPGGEPKGHYKQLLGLTAEWVGIFVGSMERRHAYKGIPVLLEALSHLSDLDLQVIFVGDGELRASYLEMAEPLVRKGRVKFLGRVDKRDLVDCYRASDFMVLPSTSVESQPIVILEAMATGLPIITTNLPGPSELVEEGMNGYIARSGSSRGLETAIRTLTRENLDSKSRNSRLLAEQKHSYERVIGAYLDEYSALLE